MKTRYIIIGLLLWVNSLNAQTTLVAGDIAITGYLGFGASNTVDQFSFVLLKNITSGTVIHFTDNAWTTDNNFRAGEFTVTWTSTSALSAGQEIRIVGTTPTLAAGPGTAGTATGANLALSANGDQVIAYQSAVEGVPPFTFITAIHSNVYTIANGNPTTTTAAAWEALDNANSTPNSSAIPPGLTTGVNAIWIGIQGDINSEMDNCRFVCAGDLSTVASIKALIYDRTKWITSDGEPPGFTLPTGCAYISAPAAPTFTTQPSSITICENSGTDFTAIASGALTYLWQLDSGSGFLPITNNGTYSGATTTMLTIDSAFTNMNGYKYRCVATNGGGSTNSNQAILSVTPLPINPKLLSKIPAALSVNDGTQVSATFISGSGGTGCTDNYRYTTDGGLNYTAYTPGTNISTTGLSGGSGFVFIAGRRAGCSSSCQNDYEVLASWNITPAPVGPTSLAAGDIAFSGYLGFGPSASVDQFSFVLLKNIGSGTVIRFTDNGWTTDNNFKTGEGTLSWTSNSTLTAGQEITIVGTTPSLANGPGTAGTVTGSALSLSANGDQVIAYQSTVQGTAPFTFISAIHCNVYATSNSDPTTTTAAAWEALNNANTTDFSSAIPTGLTTGVNAIWIGTQGDINSEYDNARFINCAYPVVHGPITILRAALNNQNYWSRSNNDPPGFNLPTGCNYLLMSCPAITVTNPVVASGMNGVSFNQTFTQSGGTLPVTFSLNSGSIPNGLTLSAAGVLSGTPAAPVATYSMTIKVTDANGCTGVGPTYNLMITCGTMSGVVSGGGAICQGGSVNVTVTFTGGTSPYTFTLNNGGGMATGSSPLSKSVSPSMNTTYSVTSATDANGCPITVTGSASVTISPLQSAAFAYAKDAYCQAGADPLPVIYGNTGGTFSAPVQLNINAGSGLIDVSASTVGGPYTITYTNTGACPDSKTFAVSIVNCIPGATLVDAITIDNGTLGKADPGDRIKLTSTITNAQTADYTGVQLITNNDSRVTFVANSFKSTPVAVNDLYATTLNTMLTVAVGSGLLVNDFDDNIPGLTVTIFPDTSTQGGVIAGNANGSFTYSPMMGFTGNDTFTYTITDSDSQTNSATVKIHVQ